MSDPAAVCRPRNPASSDYYLHMEDHFEVFVRIYDEHCSRQYRLWRPYVRQVIYRYLDSEISTTVFIRVKCRLQAVIPTSNPN